MQIQNAAHLAPGVCFLCELRPVEGVRVVDTLRDFRPDSYTGLNGRKYVCEHCVAQLVKLFGFVSEAEWLRAVAEVAALNSVIEELEGQTQALKDFRELADRFLPPKPAKKPVKSVETAE